MLAQAIHAPCLVTWRHTSCRDIIYFESGEEQNTHLICANFWTNEKTIKDYLLSAYFAVRYLLTFSWR